MSINPNNISSLSSPSLVNNAKGQLASQAKTKTKQTIISKTDELKNKISELKSQITSSTKNYDQLSQNVQKDVTLTQEEKLKKIEDLQKRKNEEVKLIENEIEKYSKDLGDINKDPLKKAKAEKKKINASINKDIKTSQIGFTLANASRNKQVLQNAAKTIAPIIISQLTNILVRLATQNGRLQRLVNRTNAVIEEANASNASIKLQQARILRSNALRILNLQEQRLTKIRNVINRIQQIITILKLVIVVLKLIFTPPPPVGLGPMPPPIRIRILKLENLIDALSLALSIAKAVLDQAILSVNNLKSQLKDIGNILDSEDIIGLLSKGDFNTLLFNNVVGPEKNYVGILDENYKGFKFAIREETGPNAIVVAGNKRRYAAAIDTNNVEVLKSELSFTLDPQDLVETLKIIIDRENLIA